MRRADPIPAGIADAQSPAAAEHASELTAQSYLIGPATPDDAPAMLDLQRRAFAEEGRRSRTQDIPPLTEQLDAVSGHIRTQTALVARDRGAIIGTIRGIVENRVCTVRALVVDPACQGRGVGSALLDALERKLTDVTRFDLTTNTLMEANVPFYERRGYEVVEFTRHSARITLAQMSKIVHASAQEPRN